MREFIAELTSEKAMGEDGYLADRGLVPSPASERAKVRQEANALTVLVLPR
jgi:phosphate transport system substrate-binding protein